MTFEELQMNLNLVFDKEDKMKILDAVASRCRKRYFFVDDNGECYLFDKNGDFDDIKKIKILRESHIRQDIKKIKIPDSVTSISDFAFSNCSGLTSITIPDSVMSIRNGTFYNCSCLTNVIIGNSVTSIGDYVFFSCSRLTSMTIPNSVTSIGDKALFDCKKLKKLIFKGKTLIEVKSMKNYPFGLKDESIIKVE